MGVLTNTTTNNDDNDTRSGTPLLFIGAALGRTGTISTKVALESLGHKVFHGKDILTQPYLTLIGNIGEAGTMYGRNSTKYNEAIDRLVEQWSIDGYTGTLDTPVAALFEDLIQRYPNAKVLLTTRNSESWAKSFVSTVGRFAVLLNRRPMRWLPPIQHLEKLGNFMLPVAMNVDTNLIDFNGIPTYDGDRVGSHVSFETAVKIYENYHQKVEETVPSDKLVRFNVRDGWQPLCDNIDARQDGQACPSDLGMLFPRVNSGKNGVFAVVILVVEAITWTWPCLLLAMLYMIVWFLRKLMFTTITTRQNLLLKTTTMRPAYPISGSSKKLA